MSVIQNLTVDKLSLRGLGAEFNSFERLFRSKADAEQAIATGDYNPIPGKLNSVLIAGQEQAIQFWSFELEKFVPLQSFAAVGNQSNKFINLDGVNDYIEFTNAGNVLDFSQDWTIGITLVGLSPDNSGNITLFSRGGVHITLKASSSTNWGLYVTSDSDLYNSNKRAQANTWYKPEQLSRLLFTYNASAKRLKYFIGNPANGSFAMRANLRIPQTMIDGQNISGGLKIGSGWTGNGGSLFSGVNWRGGVNNLIGSSLAFTGAFLNEYFQNQSNDPENPDQFFYQSEFYDDLDFYCKLGEDTFPTVSDEKSFLTGGVMTNGTIDDFKNIPTT